MRLIGYKESLNVLNKYKIKVVDSQIINSQGQINKFLKICQYPAVIKAYSPTIAHKNKAGLVKTGISDEKMLLEKYVEIIRILKKNNTKDYEIVLQKDIKGNEFIIGAKYDETFGYIVIFGLGGIYTELLKTVAIRICPIKDEIARDMIEEIAVSILSKNIKKELANIILKVSRLVENEKIKEFDLNPVIVNDKGISIVDVRVLL